MAQAITGQLKEISKSLHQVFPPNLKMGVPAYSLSITLKLHIILLGHFMLIRCSRRPGPSGILVSTSCMQGGDALSMHWLRVISSPRIDCLERKLEMKS